MYRGNFVLQTFGSVHLSCDWSVHQRRGLTDQPITVMNKRYSLGLKRAHQVGMNFSSLFRSDVITYKRHWTLLAIVKDHESSHLLYLNICIK